MTEVSDKVFDEKKSNIPDVFTLEDCEKKPDNPLFSHEKQKQKEYVDTLQAQVDFLRAKDPSKYHKYQSIGESLMDCTYDPVSGIDNEGDCINAQKILYMIRDYGLEDDLSKEELHLIVRVYGEKWRDRIDEL